MLNVFFSLVAVLLGLVLIFQGLFANTTLLMMGLLLLLLGPLLCRVGYELILLRIMQVKATREINRKLSFLVPEGAAQAAEEEDLPKEPEAEAPAAKSPTQPLPFLRNVVSGSAGEVPGVRAGARKRRVIRKTSVLGWVR